jgi:hypothetical protein
MRASRRGDGGGSGPRRWLRTLLLVGLALSAGPAAAETEPSTNYWPFYDARTDPVDHAVVQSGLGPLLLSSRSLDGSIRERAFRPFFFEREDVSRQSLEWEVLYPLMTYRQSERDWEFQFLLLFNSRGEGSDPAQPQEFKTDLFPLFFSGTSVDGESYWALLPFGGRVLDRLSQDEMEFVLFPLYSRFVKQGRVTTWFLWPLVSLIGGDSTGFRIFPLYGQEEKPGVLERRFALWPLFLYQRAGLDTDNPTETLSLLPFYVGQRSRDWDRFQVLWPFFAYTQDREREFEEWDAPWPLVKIARGAGRTITRFFPLFAIEERHLRNEFMLRELHSRDLMILYPLYVRNEEETPSSLRVRDRILWWIYSDIREEGRDGSTRRVDAWPFVRYERDREGNVVFQTLALLEGLNPGNEYLERNWSPLWSVYTYRQNPAGDTVHSFLWNFVRHEETAAGVAVEVLGPVLRYRETGEASVFSLFGGLVAYEVRDGQRSVRVLDTLMFSWRETPQAIAILEATGGQR